MACSNNVVRCALTPKFRDVDLLVDMLTYNMAAPAVLHPHIVDDNRKRFTPPVADFEIEDVHVRVTVATVAVDYLWRFRCLARDVCTFGRSHGFWFGYYRQRSTRGKSPIERKRRKRKYSEADLCDAFLPQRRRAHVVFRPHIVGYLFDFDVARSEPFSARSAFFCGIPC